MEKLELISRLKTKELSAGEFLLYIKNIITGIKRELPELTTVSVWDERAKAQYFFNDALEDFTESNFDRILIYDRKQDVFYNKDEENKDLESGSKSWIGFSTLINLSTEKKQPSDMSIHILQGATDPAKTSLINIEFSDDFQAELSKDFLVKIIRVLERTGDLAYATVISDELLMAVKKQGQNLWIGYLTYLENKRALSLDNNLKY